MLLSKLLEKGDVKWWFKSSCLTNFSK